jgi:hypothetical protein
MVMAGVPMVEIARMLGDTVAMIESTYGKHSPDFLRSAADALAGEPGPRIIRFCASGAETESTARDSADLNDQLEGTKWL